MILGWKRIHNSRRTLSGFIRIFLELCRSKGQLAPPHGNIINGVAYPKVVYMQLLFQILTDLFLKKKTFYGTYMGRKQLFESFFKNGCSEQLVFWGWSIFANSNFICTRFLLLYSWQCLPQQGVLEESIRIFIYQTEQSYIN